MKDHFNLDEAMLEQKFEHGSSQPASLAHDDGVDENAYHENLLRFTKDDQADMSRMGKVQELRRNYRPLSALAFTVIIQNTWEVLLTYAIKFKIPKCTLRLST